MKPVCSMLVPKGDKVFKQARKPRDVAQIAGVSMCASPKVVFVDRQCSVSRITAHKDDPALRIHLGHQANRRIGRNALVGHTRRSIKFFAQFSEVLSASLPKSGGQPV